MMTGIAIVFGDDINTDLLHPSYFFSLNEKNVRDGFMGALESVRERGSDQDRIIIAGQNFGCGSSRETTMTALKLAGVKAVVAESFGRIFFRNALSLGVPVMTTESLAGFAVDGDPLSVTNGILSNARTGHNIRLDSTDPFWAEVLEQGGMMEFLRHRGQV